MIFALGNVICAYSRRPRNMSLAYGDTKDVLRNRNDFLNTLGIDYKKLVCAKQIHGSRIRYVREVDEGSGALSDDAAIADTDALITDKINLALAVFTADCLPVFLYDCAKCAFGLIHAGWKGTKGNITANTVRLMQEKFNTQARHLYAGFGPAIRECCYEVGEEFNSDFNQGMIQRNNRYYLDLISVNKKQLLDSGVKEENIFDSKICTSCRNDEFFSYRKEGAGCGRIMSVMILKHNA